MSLIANCDCLIFDCDGVLVDSEVLSIKAILEVLCAADVPATLSMIEAGFGTKIADTLARVAEETGTEVPTSVALDIWPTTLAIFERELRPTVGITGFLDRLPSVPRCVASSSDPHRIAVSLTLTGLLDRFGSNIFSASQVARGKPAPDLFFFAARQMNVDPSRCIVLEDSKFGVRGARAAEMTAIGFTGGSHVYGNHALELADAGATYVSSDWSDILHYLTR